MPPTKGSVKSRHLDAVEDGDHRGDDLPEELQAGGQVEDVVEHPHRGDQRGTARIALV